MTMKECGVCGKLFAVVSWRKQRHCSRECSNAWKGSREGTAERFWSKVDKSGGPDSCWRWLAALDTAGYGKFSVGPKGANFMVRASRFALATRIGDFGDLFACHTCDNKWCCNPAHLFPGTPKDNAVDCMNKGRTNKGAKWFAHERNHVHIKLDEATVMELRALRSAGAGVTDLAKSVGLSEGAMSRVLRGERWRHVPAG